MCAFWCCARCVVIGHSGSQPSAVGGVPLPGPASEYTLAVTPQQRYLLPHGCLSRVVYKMAFVAISLQVTP